HNALRDRLKYQASPLAIVLRNASSFMCATISTSPVAASVATQVTSPDASNLGWKANPSSRSLVSTDVDTVVLAQKKSGEVTGSVLAPGTGNAAAPPDC